MRSVDCTAELGPGVSVKASNGILPCHQSPPEAQVVPMQRPSRRGQVLPLYIGLQAGGRYQSPGRSTRTFTGSFGASPLGFTRSLHAELRHWASPTRRLRGIQSYPQGFASWFHPHMPYARNYTKLPNDTPATDKFSVREEVAGRLHSLPASRQGYAQMYCSARHGGFAIGLHLLPGSGETLCRRARIPLPASGQTIHV